MQTAFSRDAYAKCDNAMEMLRMAMLRSEVARPASHWVFRQAFFFRYPEELEGLEDEPWKFFWLGEMGKATGMSHQINHSRKAAVMRCLLEGKRLEVFIELEDPAIGSLLFFGTKANYSLVERRFRKQVSWLPVPFEPGFLNTLAKKADRVTYFEMESDMRDKTLASEEFGRCSRRGVNLKAKLFKLIGETFPDFSVRRLSGRLIPTSNAEVHAEDSGLLAWEAYSETVRGFVEEFKLALWTRHRSWTEHLNRWNWEGNSDFPSLFGSKASITFKPKDGRAVNLLKLLERKGRKNKIHSVSHPLNHGLTRVVLHSLVDDGRAELILDERRVDCFTEKKSDVALAWRFESLLANHWGSHLIFRRETGKNGREVT